MKKSIYTLFLLVCFVLTGVSFSSNVLADVEDEIYFQHNAIRVARSVDEKITLSYILPVNSVKMRELNFGEDEISTFKFFLSIYVSAWANGYKDKLCDGVVLKNCVYWKEFDGVGFSLVFDDVDAQQKFFGINQQQSSPQKLDEKGVFFKKISITTNFPVASEESAKSLQKIYFLALENWQKEENIDDKKMQNLANFLQNCNFIYDFSTASNALFSEKLYTIDGVVHNVFIKNLEQIKQDSTITFWTKSINKPMWCLVILVVVLMGVFVSFLVINFKEKRKKC